MSQLEFWIWMGLLGAAAIIAFAWVAKKLQPSFTVHSGAYITSIALYFFCCGMAVGSGFVAHKLALNADAMLSPTTATNIAADWRNDLRGDERTRLTKALAQSIYINSGRVVSYLDDKGVLVPLTPSDEDQKARQSVVQKIDDTNAFARHAFVASIIWLLVPLIGLTLFVLTSRRNLVGHLS
ncbi:MAG TPA: hypothetical protein VF928_09690 [Usitatibacteraceae bacterium]